MSADIPTGQALSVADLKAVGFDETLGLEMRSATPDEIVATMEIGAKHHQPYGIVHGGVYCAIAESVASTSGVVWLMHTGLGTGAVGVNNNTDFLKSVPSGTITATSKPVHRGKRQQLWQVDMTDDQGQLLATSRVRLQNLA
ncbi:PaaI family thioesterase [Gordonia sp. TBRC 11910]|uniref:PaaI family thioesterase n=1 Tax=Gordonia asplenii TaxID=2725283 RepID=A0A848KTX2_9ACTN|nr:PaaI family thioesterase [Gordonia asplenii]NMO00325.1 PaaI family thioesterase [Gordonia asplenii]